MKKTLTLTALTLSLALAGRPLDIQEVEAQEGFEWVARSFQDIMASVIESKNQQIDYIVQWGDTLNSIAAAMDMSVLELAALNQIENPDLIIAGSTISVDRQNHTVSINDQTYSAINGNQISDNSLVESSQNIETSEWTQAETSEVMVAIDIHEIETTTEVLETWESPVTTEIVSEEETSESPVTSEISTQVETSEVIETTIEETTEETTIEETTEAPLLIEEETSKVETTEQTRQAPVYSGQDLTAYEAFDLITKEYGLSAVEIEQWASIIERESGFNHTIANPYSGAYGLPQALPGSKMASHGSDWATNPYTQLAWMYDYMASRYGSISGAYNFWQNNHWY